MHAVVGVTHAHFLLRGTVLRSDACCAVIDAAKPRVHVNNTPPRSVRDAKSGTFTCRSARTLRNLLSCSLGVISASPIIVRLRQTADPMGAKREQKSQRATGWM